MKKVALHNLGCKVNAYETESIQQQFEDSGYVIVPFAPGADIYVINTCTVTNIADRKSRQMLHRAKKMNPDSIVVATGCYVQTAGVQDEAVDIVVGNNKKKEIVQIVEDYLALSVHNAFQAAERKEHLLDINATAEYETMHLSRAAEHTRAYIKVQDGCNQFCTYCIIPHARGRVRSRKKEDVVQEVRALAANGYKEIVLTGIHLSSYGIDFGEAREDLLSLMQAVHEVAGIRRIRLGSLEPRIITEAFMETFVSLEKMCPHFHLSLQSGCDQTLRRMNRHYTAAEYQEKCELIRRFLPRAALTTDIIAGFPGETTADFEACLDFVADIHFFETHIFRYSRRQGTKAAGMKDQIPEQLKMERSRALQQVHEKNRRSYLESMLGQSVEVLLEDAITHDQVQYFAGHTKEYIKVIVKQENLSAGQIVSGRLERVMDSGFVLCVQNY